MVFESISKSLSEVTDKVTSTAGKAAETVTSPIKGVTDSVSKTVLGPKLDLIAHAHDIIAAKELLADYKKGITSLGTSLKKEGVAATKITTLKKTLSSYHFSDESFDDQVKHLLAFLKDVKKELKDGYQVVGLKDGALTVQKSRKWTAKEKPSVVAGLEELQERVESCVKALASLPDFYTSSLTVKNGQKELMDSAKKALEENHDAGLDASSELVGAWRSYLSVLRSIERNQKRIDTYKQRKQKALPTEKKHFDVEINALLKKNQQLVKKEAAGYMKDIEALEKKLEDHYEKETTILTGFEADYKTYQEKLFAWQSANAKKTVGVVKTTKTKNVQAKKAYTQLEKKDLTAYKAIERGIKNPYTDTQGFIKLRDAQVKTHNAYVDYFAEVVATGLSQLTHVQKDVQTKRLVLDAHHTYIYDDSVLLKVAKIYLSFANRYHKKHTTLAKNAWDKLLDLKASDKELFTPLVRAVQKKAERYTSWTKTNSKNMKEYIGKVDALKSSLLSVVRLQTVVDEELAWLEVRKTALLLPSYTTALASIEKAMATHNKALAKRSDEIEGAIKKTEVELEDKEQSLSVKSTKKGKKEVETLHNKKDNQALFLDLFEHYKDELVDHVKEAKDLKEGYKKSLKSAQKDMKRKESRIKALMKKVNKKALLKELNWTNALSNKSASL